MKVIFDQSFHKRLIKIDDKTLLEKIKKVILNVESAEGIQQIHSIKKMEGFKTYYRIRVGDFRIGLEIKKDTVLFITIANRKEIYKIFP
ncbi:type II toxin-antitoxin system toxin RelE3 [Nemorincola caseinilytica]|uniref:Type II toxin-antitoxin system toxin RelE3 n=1 Tax=Nemorincola caseinilytica TaxID=2054315 RepID=A0ABP8NEP6_9BACT